MVRVKDRENKNRLAFAMNLESLMRQYGKTRKDLCNDLGIKYMTLSDWLKGKSYPRIERLEQLANYFHIPVSELVKDYYSQYSQGVKLPDGITIIDVRTNMPYELVEICKTLDNAAKEKLLDYARTLKRLQDLENRDRE